VNPADKNTALLFGDAATVTLISGEEVLLARAFECGTRGREGDSLMCKDKVLIMNGRAVFNFSAVEVPRQIRRLLDKAGLAMEEIDVVLLHQGSRFILDTVGRRLGLGRDKLPSNISSHGNTVSSSIPLLLSDYLGNTGCKRIVISGFGVGLSWASAILERKQ
jgi:3-oxoacyl-[acyl-carrier-protein] synthase-3